MGKYHNKLDKKYFNKSVYIRKFEEVFNVKIKDYPLQYELIFETYNTLIMFNNILFSLNYIPINQKVDNILHLLNSYANKYRSKINKCYDRNCIMIFNALEDDIEEFEEMKRLYLDKKIKYNLKPIESAIDEYIRLLDFVEFDKLKDSKKLSYKKLPNDKLPKKVNLKIYFDTDIIDSTMFNLDDIKKENKKFFDEYFKRTGINLKEDKEQFDYIIRTLYHVENLNNAIVNYYIYDDKTILNIHTNLVEDYFHEDNSFVKDITITNITNKLKVIVDLIKSNEIEKALNNLQEIINQFNDLFERIS